MPNFKSIDQVMSLFSHDTCKCCNNFETEEVKRSWMMKDYLQFSAK